MSLKQRGRTDILSLRELFETFKSDMDVSWMLANTERLWKIEIGQRYSDHRRAARFVERLMTSSGLRQVRRIPFPADGKTTYQDKVTPLAWEATIGRLTVRKSPVHIGESVVADYARHPFHLVRGSVSAPKGGTLARLVTEEQMYGGFDVRGAMVITAPETRANGPFLRSLCDLGALGFVNDHLKDRYLTPDGIGWVNACTEGPHWHIHDDDRSFIGFSVSPRMGDQLRAAARAGEVQVLVESDGRRYAGEVDVVTATIPGRDRRELWLLSHLYEPMPDDNAAGVIGAIEVARTIQRLVEAKRLPPLQFTLRLVFGLEMYGFAAYAHQRGGDLRDQVIGALNMDAMAVGPKPGTIELAPAGTPFFGDYVMEELYRSCREEPHLSFKGVNLRGAYMDDMFLSDSTNGVPTIWPRGAFDLWHNSEQEMDLVHPQRYLTAAAFSAAWTARMLTLGGETFRTQLRSAVMLAEEHLRNEAGAILKRASDAKADRQGVTAKEARRTMGYRRRWESGRLSALVQHGRGTISKKSLAAVIAAGRRMESELLAELRSMPGRAPRRPSLADRNVWEQIAATLVPSRATAGLPFDLRRAPKEERRSLPNSVIYGALARVLAGMDGRKTLEELLNEAAWETGASFSSGQVRELIGAVEFLTEHGYLRTRCLKPIRKRDIIPALERLGLDRGDLVMLHSGLSGLGHIEGGPDAVIESFLSVLGRKGTLLVPTFSRSEVILGGAALRSRTFRPYHPAKSVPWVGRIPARFLHWEGVKRSAHPTHSVAGIGPLAEVCLRDHQEDDPPVCRRSPFGRLIDHDGKMVWFGADLASTTFFHLLEDELRLPYLSAVLCRVERSDGALATVHVPRYLPGHRDFYAIPGEKGKLYRRLFEDGLLMRRTRLGFGDVKLIRARPMYDLGIAALKQDPDLLLCDSPDCLFCRTFSSRR